MLVLSLSGLLAAVFVPVSLPAPVPTQVDGCSSAACTGDPELRVCLCVPVEGLPPGITVDRPALGEGEARHVEWDAQLLRGAVDDFEVVKSDLDGDGVPEVVVASHVGDDPHSVHVVAIVDGQQDVATLAWSEDFGPDAVMERAVLFTEWEGASFVGREFTYVDGRLEPTRAPVLRRNASAEFATQRGTQPRAPRAWLAAREVTRGVDAVPAGLHTVGVAGLTTDDGVLGLHLELPGGGIASLSVTRESPTPLRFASATLRRLYPPGYSPPAAEAWLSGRLVSVALQGLVIKGPVWLDAPGAKVPVKSAHP